MRCNDEMVTDANQIDGSPGNGSLLDDDLLFASVESEGASDGLELYLNLSDAGIDDEILLHNLSELFGAGSDYAAQVAVINSSYPQSTVVHLDVLFPNGFHKHGSGVMVGRNDVLTAGHVLYDPSLGGLAMKAQVSAGQWGQGFATETGRDHDTP